MKKILCVFCALCIICTILIIPVGASEEYYFKEYPYPDEQFNIEVNGHFWAYTEDGEVNYTVNEFYNSDEGEGDYRLYLFTEEEDVVDVWSENTGWQAWITDFGRYAPIIEATLTVDRELTDDEKYYLSQFFEIPLGGYTVYYYINDELYTTLEMQYEFDAIQPEVPFGYSFDGWYNWGEKMQDGETLYEDIVVDGYSEIGIHSEYGQELLLAYITATENETLLEYRDRKVSETDLVFVTQFVGVNPFILYIWVGVGCCIAVPKMLWRKKRK